MDPIDQISDFLMQLKSRNLLAPICLGTISKDGFPNSRFVDLKEVSEGRLYFGTDDRSVKAAEFLANPQVSISAWWEALEVQVRVMGKVERGSESMSDKIFSARNRSAKAIATISRQSEELKDFEGYRHEVAEFLTNSGSEIARPTNWWVYGVLPADVEILRFSSDRVHVRKQYHFDGKSWQERGLYP